MEEIGLPGRDRDHTVDVTVTMSVQVTVPARSEDAALDAVTDDGVRSAIRDAVTSYYGTDMEWTANEAELSA
jgi:hypothetical protein